MKKRDYMQQEEARKKNDQLSDSELMKRYNEQGLWSNFKVLGNLNMLDLKLKK